VEVAQGWREGEKEKASFPNKSCVMVLSVNTIGANGLYLKRGGGDCFRITDRGVRGKRKKRGKKNPPGTTNYEEGKLQKGNRKLGGS